MAQQPHVKVRPKEFTGFLLNPHKGCETFQRFNGDPLGRLQKCHEEGPIVFPAREFEGVTPGYLPSTVSYCRWFWEIVEPEDGRYDFTVIERSLETARERGQTLHVRLMPHGAPGQPPLPRWYVGKYPTRELERYNAKYIAAIYDGPEYFDKWGALITEFGRRFDGHPDLELVDMSYIGMWGEGDGECSTEGVDRMTKVYTNAHPVTPLVTMITGYKMTAGVRAGTGWRADSCDDLGLWGDPTMGPQQRWNHLYDSYPQSVVEGGAQDAWRTAPVAFEPGKHIRTAHELGFDLDFIIRQDLKYHGSLISMKSETLPEPWMDRLLMFCNDLGYRFVLRQFKVDARVARGGALEYTCWIENVGVAPIYRQYDFAVRFAQGNHVHVARSNADVKTWLPGDAFLRETVALPGMFQKGSVMLHAALVDPETGEPKVRFANEGVDDGWLALDTIDVM